MTDTEKMKKHITRQRGLGKFCSVPWQWLPCDLAAVGEFSGWMRHRRD